MNYLMNKFIKKIIVEKTINEKILMIDKKN